MFSCEFYEIVQGSFFLELSLAAASAPSKKYTFHKKFSPDLFLTICNKGITFINFQGQVEKLESHCKYSNT